MTSSLHAVIIYILMLRKDDAHMSFIPKAQQIYKHFKGNLYQIVAVATHTETEEQLVIYQAMYGDFKIYARPLHMFTSKVDKDKYPDVLQEYRFELQGCVGACGDGAIETEEGETPESLQIQGVKSEKEETPKVEPQPATTAQTREEAQIDPLVLEFLDAGSHEERLNILAALHHRITDAMLFTMAIASDIELSEGTTEEKYEELKNCLLTLDRYEIQRIK